MQLYAITDRSLLPSGDEAMQALPALARSWAEGGVAYIQIREKDLAAGALAALSAAMVAATAGYPTRVLVNGPPHIALAADACGVHLPAGWASNATASASRSATGDPIAAARRVFAERRREAVISVACHSSEEAVLARDLGADLALLAPVFEKRLREPRGLDQPPDHELPARPGMGLAAFAEACRMAAPLPVFALGGVTAARARQCVAAGAAGVAAIRLFVGWKENWRALAREKGGVDSLASSA
jgi:thiamine-phosphate pyrophosphorylase